MAGTESEPSPETETTTKFAAQTQTMGESEPVEADQESSRVQHHVSRILDDVLEDEPEQEDTTLSKKRLGFHMFFDVMLSLGLLLAMGGISIGFFKMYILHSAQQSMIHRNFQAAITTLKSSPFPAIFDLSGNQQQQLLDEALYMDAMQKIDDENDVAGALKELQEIRPGSQFFDYAQTIITDNSQPSSTVLQGSVSEQGAAQQKSKSSLETLNEIEQQNQTETQSR